MSKKVMVIRHAEKPVPDKVNGVRARGEIDASSLTTLGWQRAGALVRFFEHPTYAHIKRPENLFTVRYDLPDANSSRRPRQTLRPLSQALGLSINDGFGKEQESKLVAAVDKLEGTVLIAWSHENILKIVTALGMESETPAEWPDERFELGWVFDRVRSSWKFARVAQRLLAGDSDAVCPVPGTD